MKVACLSWLKGHREGGFTLVEGMVALVLLAVGMLAIVCMQVVALTGNLDANELSVTTNLAADMIERIRYNTRNVDAYGYIDTTDGMAQPPNTPTGRIARGDYEQWRARLDASRLGTIRGLGDVAPIGPAGLNERLVSVTIMWTSNQGYGASMVRPHTITLTTVVTL